MKERIEWEIEEDIKLLNLSLIKISSKGGGYAECKTVKNRIYEKSNRH